jgi:hypothetical protein
MTRPGTLGTEPRAERAEVGPPALSRLAEADYADAFRIASEARLPAEQWARCAFEGGPRGADRLFVLVAWQGVLGLRLAPPDLPGHLAGWAIVENEPKILVLHAESWLMVARMVVDVSDSHTTLTTLLRYKRPAARRMWVMAGIAHRALAPRVLGRAGRSLTR